jgi:hypothetical protein
MYRVCGVSLGSRDRAEVADWDEFADVILQTRSSPASWRLEPQNIIVHLSSVEYSDSCVSIHRLQRI